jgi:hypothetical protein
VHEANLFQQAQHQLLLSTHFKFWKKPCA